MTTKPSTSGDSLIQHLPILLLLFVTAAVFLLCYQIVLPFFPVFTWSLALAVVMFPVYSRVQRRIPNENAAALVSVIILGVVMLGPASFIFREIGTVAIDNARTLTEVTQGQGFKEFIASKPKLRRFYSWANRTFDLERSSQEVLKSIQDGIPLVLGSSISTIVQLLLIFFTVFFLLRDKRLILNFIRKIVPLSGPETTEIFTRVKDTIYATTYGTIFIAAVQGSLGGLMFWFLGLPAPLLWGLVMTALSLLPYLGAFFVWIPAALYLALKGDWSAAVLLSLWGTFVIGTIDNVLFPILVGKRLHFHTLTVFFFILGGVMFFGSSGIVLGPVTLAVARGLLEVWKRRMAAVS